MISEALLVLAKCFKVLGIVDYDNEEQIKSIQSKMFLLKLFGADLGYMFIWNRWGPYSKSLGRDAGIFFEHQREAEAHIDKASFKPDFETALNKAQKLFDSIPDSESTGIRRSVWLEILSSLAYLVIKDSSVDKLSSDFTERKQVEGCVINMKPHLRKYQPYFDTAWDQLKDSFPALSQI